MALLRVFDVIDGARDYIIGAEQIIVGRDSGSVDVCLHDMAVSRMHLKIYAKDGGYFVEDLGSSCGTLVNNELTKVNKLNSGDNLQLGSTVIEFLDEETESYDEKATDTVDGLMGQFRALPSQMMVSYRVLKIVADEVFNSGDTVVVGRGGLLVNIQLNPLDLRNVIELKIEWPNGTNKIVLGEVVAVLQKNSMACIKLHHVPEIRLNSMIDKVERSSWNKVNQV